MPIKTEEAEFNELCFFCVTGVICQGRAQMILDAAPSPLLLIKPSPYSNGLSLFFQFPFFDQVGQE